MSSSRSRGNKGKAKVGELPNTWDPNFIPESFPSETQDNQQIPINLGDDEEIAQLQQHESQGSGTVPTPTPTQDTQQGRPPRSDIFGKHYHKITLPNGKAQRAVCNHCGVDYAFRSGGGYGTLWNHILNKHPVEAGVARGQTQMQGYSSSNPTQLFNYNEKKQREEFAKLVCVEHLSFSFGEKLRLENWVKTSLQPAFNKIPRSTVTKLVKNLYKNEKRELAKFFFKFDGRVSLCSDIWSDSWQSNSYMGITCHWIDDDWNLQKRLLAYRLFNEAHTAQNIWKIIHVVLQEYNLVAKIFSISFDNASANTASIPELIDLCQPSFGGKFFHIRCVCHILNLCVQDGIKNLKVYLEPIKTALSYLWNFTHVKREWLKFCKLYNKRPKKFPQDCPTRWNSTYQLLNESWEYRELLCAFFSQNNFDIVLLPQQWDVCSKVLQVLKTFNDATYVLSGVYYPTCHLLIEEAVNIADVLLEARKETVLVPFVNVMLPKWLKYFERFPPLNLVATVFDPRIRLEGLEAYLTTYYECLGEMIDLGFVDNATGIPNLVSNIKEDVKRLLKELYVEYSIRLGSPTQTPQSSQINQPSGIGKRARAVIAQLSSRPRGSSSSSQELDNYLMTIFEFDDSFVNESPFPILRWWKQHSLRFPVLAAIAKDILTCPASTVPVEQVFSAGGNILSDTRSRLSPDSLEAQACVDDWAKAETREQQSMEPSNEDLYDVNTATSASGAATGESQGSYDDED